MLSVQLLLLVLNGQVGHAGRVSGTRHSLGRVRTRTGEDFVLALQENLGGPTDDGGCVSAYLLLERFFPFSVDDLNVRVILVIFFMFGTVLVVMWFDFVKLIDICCFYRRSLLSVVRFSVGYRLRYFCILSQVRFVHWLVGSSIDQWSCNVLFERLIFLHGIDGSLFDLRRAQLVWHHRDR